MGPLYNGTPSFWCHGCFFLRLWFSASLLLRFPMAVQVPVALDAQQLQDACAAQPFQIVDNVDQPALPVHALIADMQLSISLPFARVP